MNLKRKNWTRLKWETSPDGLMKINIDASKRYPTKSTFRRYVSDTSG